MIPCDEVGSLGGRRSRPVIFLKTYVNGLNDRVNMFFSGNIKDEPSRFVASIVFGTTMLLIRLKSSENRRILVLRSSSYMKYDKRVLIKWVAEKLNDSMWYTMCISWTSIKCTKILFRSIFKVQLNFRCLCKLHNVMQNCSGYVLNRSQRCGMSKRMGLRMILYGYHTHISACYDVLFFDKLSKKRLWLPSKMITW